MAGHTPGPWCLEWWQMALRDFHNFVPTGLEPIEYDPEEKYGHPGFNRREYEDADARLIAAAPDLLAALRGMPCYGCSTTPGDNSADALRRSRSCVTCRPARAAITKAESAMQ